ncbi:MAG TPA: adenylate/guanylate cyclase domain-containing protein, partial [Mycobacterium sp.]|nr:adenylate/guanylate cyclase domain-containing protein [Mycobacterium sp.]
MRQLPIGTVTFLFSDIEGSTRLLDSHRSAFGPILARHHAVVESTVEQHGGVVFETIGDGVYAAFARPGSALAAAIAIHRRLAAEDWRPVERLAVRIALHTGEVERRGDHYFGTALFRTARIQALAHGEQTLVSAVTASLASDALPPGASLRDLGTHRLKDLGEPEHIQQLDHVELRSEFPPLRGLDSHRHNLPVQLTSFVGRNHELSELPALLDSQRLLTLTGPGGIGKTRLGLQVAAERIDKHRDGVFLVELGPVSDARKVPAMLTTTLGATSIGTPAQERDAIEHLRDAEVLLILDNLEQLLPDAATFISQLLAEAPGVRVLATSRAPLRVRGESEYPVVPLSAGANDRLDQQMPAAVTLFVERARTAGSQLTIDAHTGPLIAEICDRLDGLPLAI